MQLSGKVALVTGAGSGLGAAAARTFAAEGAEVVLVSRTRAQLEQIAAEIEKAGGRASVFPADTADETQMEQLFGSIANEHGRLDIVFANAGINGVWAPIAELKPKEWDETIRVNLRGTYLTVHHAVPLLRKAGGSVIITSSINGTRTFTTAGASAYSTTKAGQLALGQMLALELAKDKIRVNIICPGAIESEISDNTEKRATDAAKVPAKYPKGTVPLTGGKPGTAHEVADLVLFLASDASKHITGTPIWIDGGQSLLM
jgi:NAD(P)-dependent dehydrogenase (short-subunit alcohol dehydrogenase family)